MSTFETVLSAVTGTLAVVLAFVSQYFGFRILDMREGHPDLAALSAKALSSLGAMFVFLGLAFSPTDAGVLGAVAFGVLAAGLFTAAGVAHSKVLRRQAEILRINRMIRSAEEE